MARVPLKRAAHFGVAGGREKSDREGLHDGLSLNLNFKPQIVG